MFSVLFALVLASPSLAHHGQQYHPGQRVRLPSAPVSIAVPKGWFGGLIPGESLFVLGSKTHAGMLVLYADPEGLKALAHKLREPIALNDETVLVLEGGVQRGRKELKARFVVPNQPALHGLVLAKLVGSTAFGVLAVGPAKDKSNQRLWMARVLRSAHAEKAAPKGAWGGKRLLYYRTGNGMAERRTIELCRDGSYRESGSDSYLSSGTTGSFSAAGRRAGSGRWSQSGNQLLLVDSEGGREAFNIRRQEGKLMLNGERWFLRPGGC
jgi:hypothetical protein